MTLDFFQRQDDFKAKSRRFFAAFAGAVALAAAVFYLAIAAVFIILGLWSAVFSRQPASSPPPAQASFAEQAIWRLPRPIYGDPPRLLAARPVSIVGLAIFAVIAGACFYRVRAVKNGGSFYVALMLNGRFLEKPATFKEKQLVDVVEEMAVAAGLPRPEIVILDREKGLNAVTAGFEPDDAIIAVTAGLLEHMDRDELQAVVAHEFAHIVNGDCALNLAMSGWLYGLLVFYVSGKNLLAWVWTRKGDPGNDFRNDPRIFLPLTLLSLVIMAGGWLGKFFAEMIQAALSRGREYLADAFAAQFTRNPAALAGALRKIGAAPSRGSLRNGSAETMKSFFIASPAGVFKALSAGRLFRGQPLFRSHPPIEERIWALEPEWDGSWPVWDFKFLSEPPAAVRRLTSRLKKPTLDWAGLALLALAGEAPAANLAEAGRALRLGLPETLRAAARNPALAPALTAAALMRPEEPELTARQMEITKGALGPEAAAQAALLSRLTAPEARLPLIDLAAPALRRLPPEAKAVLSGLIKNLIAADGRLSLFEVAAAQILKKSLGLKPAKDLAAVPLQEDASLFLSALAHVGAENPEGAFQAAQSVFRDKTYGAPLTLVPRGQIKTRDLPPLLDRLGRAPEKAKSRLAAAAVASVLHDGVIAPREYELIRALSAALDINMPLRES